MEKKSSEHRLPEPLNFLAIKQEPVEWTDFEQENGIEKPHIEVSVKPEYVYGEESNGEGELVWNWIADWSLKMLNFFL